MHRLILFCFLILTCTLGHTQQAGRLFGLNEENKLCTIDPVSGAITVLSATSLTNGAVVQAPGAIDTDGERFFFIDSNNRLVVADLMDGSLINTYEVTAGSNGALAYSCANDRLYYFTPRFLLEIEPANGISRVVLDFTLPISQLSANSMSLDDANSQLFNLLSTEVNQQLLTIGLDDQSSPTNVIAGSTLLDHLVYACHENRLFGLEGNRLKSLNPADRSLADVAEIQNLTGVANGTRTFSNMDGAYYFIGFDDSENQRLYSVNTANGTFSSTPPLTSAITNLAFANACQADAGFTVDNACSDEPINFTNTSVADRYEWNFNDPASGDENTSTDKNPSHQFSGPGTYNVSLRARTCTDESLAFRQITLVEPPDTLFSALYEKCRTDAVVISAANPAVDSYQWSTGATTDTIQVSEAGFYSVEATIDDCVKVYETEVVNIPCPCRPDMPNAFTPNNDNTNDTFRPAFIDDYCEVLLFSMKIFNRWGQLVYETDDAMQPWDGDHDGNPAPSDVYVWVIEFSYIDKDTGQQGALEMKKGDVALIR